MRAAYVATLTPAVAEAGRALLGGPVIAEYRPGWPADRTLEQTLRETEARDRATGVTQAGPHRADLRISLDARGVRDEASRGQQKLVAAALVLGQVRAHHAATKTKPVVLADDPAAELDAPSLGRLLAALDALPAQLLIATLAPAQLAVAPDSAVFHVERGKVQTV
jgi:DNA replication and repair protein RecF